MPLGLSMIWGPYGNKGVFLCGLGPQSKSGQQVNDLFTTVVFPSEIAVIKLRRTLKRLNPSVRERPWLTFLKRQ